jgi:L-methionine (R)-S-oxide reductase
MQNIDQQELEAYLSGYWISDLANFSSFIYTHMADINWAGFYLNDGKSLKLGPFCGNPACLEIPYGKGVCGKVYSTQLALIVDDVDLFPGHIRCDSNSKSELVIPFYIGDTLVGVFDLDSPIKSRFTKNDLNFLQKSIHILSQRINANKQHSFGNLLIN